MGFTAVVDYDVGNLMSVNNAMNYLGFETKVTADPVELERADGIILPGVGAFPDAAAKLVRCGMMQELRFQAQKSPSLASALECSCCLIGVRKSGRLQAWVWCLDQLNSSKPVSSFRTSVGIA